MFKFRYRVRVAYLKLYRLFVIDDSLLACELALVLSNLPNHPTGWVRVDDLQHLLAIERWIRYRKFWCIPKKDALKILTPNGGSIWRAIGEIVDTDVVEFQTKDGQVHIRRLPTPLKKIGQSEHGTRPRPHLRVVD